MAEPWCGRAWVFGSDIDTDQIIQTGFLQMFLPDEELGKHAMTIVDPAFAEQVRPGDFMIVGDNFGCGSSREEAVVALKACGISGVLGSSFARIFYRNAIHQGLRAWEVPGIHEEIQAGDRLCVWPSEGRVSVEDGSYEGAFTPLPAFLEDIISVGGLIPYHQQRLQAKRSG
ncbi:MAG: 3-isopropylmalate dehydratase [Trueperaceae bacterium]